MIGDVRSKAVDFNALRDCLEIKRTPQGSSILRGSGDSAAVITG